MGVHQSKPDQVRHRSVTEELLDIMEEVTLTLRQLLLTHRELTEGLFDQDQTDRVKLKIDSLRRKIEDEKENLTKIRHVQQRKRELERIRRKHEKESEEDSTKETQTEQKTGLVPLLNQKGQVVERIQTVGQNRVNILDLKGRLVAREINGMTLDHNGRFRGIRKTGSEGSRNESETVTITEGHQTKRIAP